MKMRYWTVHKSVLCDVLMAFPGASLSCIDFIAALQGDPREGVVLDYEGNIVEDYRSIREHPSHGTSGLCKQFIKRIIQEDGAKVWRCTSVMERKVRRRLQALNVGASDLAYFGAAANSVGLLAYSEVFTGQLLKEVCQVLKVNPHNIPEGKWRMKS